MAHLTCTAHKRRVVVVPGPDRGITTSDYVIHRATVIHRSQKPGEGECATDTVTIGGEKFKPIEVLSAFDTGPYSTTTQTQRDHDREL